MDPFNPYSPFKFYNLQLLFVNFYRVYTYIAITVKDKLRGRKVMWFLWISTKRESVPDESFEQWSSSVLSIEIKQAPQKFFLGLVYKYLNKTAYKHLYKTKTKCKCPKFLGYLLSAIVA